MLVYVDMWTGDLVHERKLSGIRRYAERRGWSVLTLGDKESRPSRLLAFLERVRSIGCIVECSHGHNDLVPSLFAGIPTVYLDSPSNLRTGRMTRVVHDGRATVQEAFRELSSLNPPAYAVVGHAVPYFWSQKRIRDFKSLATKTGSKCFSFQVEGGRRSEARQKALASWLKGLPRKTAVFAVNDVVATEVVAAGKRSHLRIPADLTLVGVDNCENVCETSDPKISSVQIDFERAGYQAALLVDGLISDRRVTSETFGPLMTVRRESTRGVGCCGPQMLKAIDLIRRDACNGLRARDVVKLFSCSRRLVDIRFREAFGHSILDEILNVRFESVFSLLSRTDVSLGTIAGRCGFGSEVTLREQFRLRTGMSMGSWRKANVRR